MRGERRRGLRRACTFRGSRDKACPERSRRSGEIVAEGTPEQVSQEPRSYTGSYLSPLLKGARSELTPVRARKKRASAWMREREAAE
jgi:excinuclease ABC subunit A